MELNMSELNLLKEELFGNPSSAISDIKFYPGLRRGASIEEIAGYTRAALAQNRDGKCREIDLTI
jgi:hypothetical protein